MEADVTYPPSPRRQRHMPRRRCGHTTAVAIGGERVYMTANGRGDGTLGEVFIQWGKQGQTQAGLMDIYALALSVGLQHGVPLLDLIRQGLDLYFVPNGHTDDPDIPRVRSVVDWVARRLAIDWLPYEVRAAEGIFTMAEREDAAAEWLATEAASLPAADTDEWAAFHAELANGIGSPSRPHLTGGGRR
jgi:hypothetical protein